MKHTSCLDILVVKIKQVCVCVIILGWELKQEKIHLCELCTIGTAKQKNVPEYSDLINESNVDHTYGHVFLNMSSLKNPKYKDPNDKIFILKPQMRFVHDKFLECRFLNWFHFKDAIVEPMC